MLDGVSLLETYAQSLLFAVWVEVPSDPVLLRSSVTSLESVWLLNGGESCRFTSPGRKLRAGDISSLQLVFHFSYCVLMCRIPRLTMFSDSRLTNRKEILMIRFPCSVEVKELPL